MEYPAMYVVQPVADGDERWMQTKVHVGCVWSEIGKGMVQTICSCHARVRCLLGKTCMYSGALEKGFKWCAAMKMYRLSSGHELFNYDLSNKRCVLCTWLRTVILILLDDWFCHCCLRKANHTKSIWVRGERNKMNLYANHVKDHNCIPTSIRTDFLTQPKKEAHCKSLMVK